MAAAATDGGSTWTPQAAPTGADLRSVDFLDASIGWAVGEAGTILKTTDGGATWTPQAAPTNADLRSVDFLDASTGWAVGEAGTILETTDGGRHWTTQPSGTTVNLRSVDSFAQDARDTPTVWAVGDSGTILERYVVDPRSGSVAWRRFETGVETLTADLYSVCLVNATTGRAVGEAGTALRTHTDTDGRLSWRTEDTRTISNLYAVSLVDIVRGFAVGEGGTILLGGGYWNPPDGDVPDLAYYAVAAGTADASWAAGEAGIILKTTDGGRRWTAQTSGTTVSLRSVDFLDGQTGWAVGDGGTILKMVNQPPVASDRTTVTDEDTPVALTLTGSDPDNDPLTFSVVTQPAHGTLTGTPPDLTYTPDAGYLGSDSFTFKANDGVLDSAPATVTILVASSTVAAQPVISQVFAGGGVHVWPDGDYIELYNPGVSPQDLSGWSLHYASSAGTASALTIPLSGVIPANGHLLVWGRGDGLPATPDLFYPTLDMSSAAGKLALCSDMVGTVSWPLDALLLPPTAYVDIVAWGSLVVGSGEPYPAASPGTSNALLRTPEGQDTNNNAVDFKLGLPMPSSGGGGPVPNRAPTVDAQTLTTGEDTPVALTLSGSDPDGDALTFRVVQQPTHGSLSGTAPNLTYTPEADYAGSDSFAYVANDGQLDSNVATVTIEVTAVNHPPEADAGGPYVMAAGENLVLVGAGSHDPDGTAQEEGLVYDWYLNADDHPDATGMALTVTWSTLNALNLLRNQAFDIRLCVTDGGGLQDAATTTLTIYDYQPVAGAIMPSTPVLVPQSGIAQVSVDGSPSFCPDPRRTIVSWRWRVAGTDTWVSGRTTVLSVDLSPLPSGSSWRISRDVELQVTDDRGAMASRSFGVSFAPTPYPPVAVPASVATEEDAEVSVTLTATDANGDPLTYRVGSPSHGILSGAAPDLTYTPAAGYHGPDSFTFTVNDGTVDSNVATVIITVTAVNHAPVARLAAPATATEGASVSLDGSASSDPDGDALAYAWDLDGDGLFDDATGVKVTTIFPDNGACTVKLRVTDGGGLDNEASTTVAVTNVAPTVGAISAPIDPVKVGTPLTASASFTDPGVLDTHTAVWDWEGATSAGSVSETNDSGTVTGTHSYTQAGVYTVKLTVTDKDGGSATVANVEYVVVYDPAAGGAIGAGWIASPAGAYAPDPRLKGTAAFGFLARYAKAASVPSGATEFVLCLGRMSFISTSYDWMVISGAKVTYQGSGRINGKGSYRFTLSAIDSRKLTGAGSDKLRIRIWDKASGTLVYDSQPGSPASADPTTVLKGGNVIITR